MDFIYKKSGGIFNMHSYWTKQPVEAIKYFMSKYSSEGDVVLDPFSGTGMTGVAAKELGRNVILNDISPISIHISKGYCEDLDMESRQTELDSFLKKIDTKLSKLYSTDCSKCHNTAPILFSIVGEVWQSKDGKSTENRGQMMLDEKGTESFNKDFIFKEFTLIKVCYKCDCSSTKLYKEPDETDISRWKTNDFKKYFYPKNSFFGQEPKRNYKRDIKEVWQLYSARNITALSIVFEEIGKVENGGLRNVLSFAFTSILFNSSLMSRYRSYENTSIKMGTFYVPPLIKDTNVLKNFETKLSLILKNKDAQFATTSKASISYLMENADDLKSIKSNSIDYIYTDPPYSDVINYAELNIVYESWLDEQTNVSNEMIVSKFYHKDIDYYANRLEKALKEAYRVLKPGAHMTLVFHHPNIEHWASIQDAVINSGFSPIKSGKPIRLISNSKTSSQHKTGKKSQCFLVFNFKKTNTPLNISLKNLTESDYIKSLKRSYQKASEKGYKSESDQFDYMINDFLFKYKLKNIT